MNGSIEIVTGTLGGGKTLLAVERAYYHLRRGGHVFSNIEIHPERIAERLALEGFQFEPDRLVQLSTESLRGFEEQIKRGTKDCPVMVVLDEAHLEWNSRDYAQSRKEDSVKRMLDFNTLARKLDIDLVYVTQSMTDIDKQLRSKAAKLVVCRNMKQLRIMGLIPLPLPFYSRVYFDISVGNPKPQKTDFDIFLLPRWVCSLYNSDALLGKSAKAFEGMEIASSTPLKRIPKLRSPGEKPKLLNAANIAAFAACVVCSI